MKKNNSLKVLSSLIGVSGAILLTSNLVQAEEGSSNQSATQSTETVVSDKNEVTAATQSVPTIDGATTTQETAGISEVNNPNINYIKVDETLPLTSETYKRKTATELATMVREKKVTPEELVELAFAEIEKQEAELNALITDKKENGLVEAKARALEEAKNLVDTGQPFLGVPLILKGLGHGIAGGDASNGLYYNGNNTSRGDGTYTRDFKTLGFIPIAQSNYPEYGYRNNTNSYLFGSSRNPWDLSLNSGGSSGGSAAAIASGMVPVASASDSGGSIRIPASWTGLVGYKPSRSAFRTENTSITSHFPITKSVEDAITLYNYYKEKQLKNDSANFSKDTNLKDYKIAYTTKSPMGTDVDPEAVEAVLNQVGFLKSQGFIVEEVEFPVNGRELMRDYTYTMIGGAVSLPRNVDKTKLDPITYGMARVRANLTAAKLGLPPISLIKYETIMSEFHEKYPILLTPTNAHIADKAESWGITEEDKERVLNIDSLPLADQVRLMVNQWEPMLRRTPFTQVFNISGGASISLPTHISDSSFPFGTMYSVKKGDDNILLNLAKYLEDNKQLILKSEIAKKIQ
ncbi:MAG: amidase family protein, partial [Gemella sp.]|nr:amidase family protein [Gemella sp.]